MAEATYAFRFDGANYRVERLMVPEMRAIQKTTGINGIVDLEAQLQAGTPEAIVGLVWVLKKRQEPTLKFQDVGGDLLSFRPNCTLEGCADEAAGPGLCKQHMEQEAEEQEADPGPRAEGNDQVTDPGATQLTPRGG